MSEKKVATEVAEQEFERFIAAMDLDVDPKGMDDDDKKGFAKAKGRVLAAIEDGRLVINDSGEPVFTPTGSEDVEPITFYEPKGDALIAMDQKKDGHNVAKTIASLATMTKQQPVRFSKMAHRDIKVCIELYILFFG